MIPSEMVGSSEIISSEIRVLKGAMFAGKIASRMPKLPCARNYSQFLRNLCSIIGRYWPLLVAIGRYWPLLLLTRTFRGYLSNRICSSLQRRNLCALGLHFVSVAFNVLICYYSSAWPGSFPTNPEVVY